MINRKLLGAWMTAVLVILPALAVLGAQQVGCSPAGATGPSGTGGGCCPRLAECSDGCCPGRTPHTCPGSTRCFETLRQAAAACGGTANVEVCGCPVSMTTGHINMALEVIVAFVNAILKDPEAKS